MIIMDTPRSTIHHGQRKMHSHLISTESHEELEEFTLNVIKMPLRWIQDAGTPRAHLDLFNSKIQRAITLNVKTVTRKELMVAIQKKEEAKKTADRLEKHLRDTGALA